LFTISITLSHLVISVGEVWITWRHASWLIKEQIFIDIILHNIHF